MDQPHPTQFNAARSRPCPTDGAWPSLSPDAARVAIVSPSTLDRRRLAALFADTGFTVLQASKLHVAQALIESEDVDLVLLNCASLARECLAFCRTLASEAGGPLLLVLAGQADVVDEIVALEVGADDLLIGAVADRLVVARAKALLRRAAPRRRSGDGRETTEGWRMNPTTRTAISPAGRSVVLAPSDASAFHLFLSNPDVVFTNEAGAHALGAGRTHPATFRTTVCRLRKKLGEVGDGDPIQTIRGVGYAYAPGGSRANLLLRHLAA